MKRPGLTSSRALFCFDQLAWDIGMRVRLRIEHLENQHGFRHFPSGDLPSSVLRAFESTRNAFGRAALDVVLRCHSAWGKQHNPTAQNGKESAIAHIEKHVSSPGFRASVKRIIAEGDMVVSHMHLQPEIDDPGLAIIDIWRLKNGKLVEHWDVTQKVPATTASGNSMF